MKKAIFLSLLSSILLTSIACEYVGAPTQTAPPSSVIASTVGAISTTSGYRYSIAGVALSAPLTITHGQSVVWDASNVGALHPLYIDNGTSCLVSGNTTFPVTQTFNSPGTYSFHCSNHASCATGCPGGACTGMVGNILVN